MVVGREFPFWEWRTLSSRIQPEFILRDENGAILDPVIKRPKQGFLESAEGVDIKGRTEGSSQAEPE